MPITYSTHRKLGWLIVEAEGVITYNDIVTHLERERDDQFLARYELINGERATLKLSSDEVRRIVEMLRKLGEKSALGPTAVVVGDDFSYGMMRMLQMLVEDVCDIVPFRTRDQARAWLDTIPGSAVDGHG
jgi:hypothetical protein